MFPICLDLSIPVSVVNIIQHVQDLSESNERDQKEIGELEEEDLQPVSDIVLHAAGRLLLKVIRGWDLNQLLSVDIFLYVLCIHRTCRSQTVHQNLSNHSCLYTGIAVEGKIPNAKRPKIVSAS